jgi:hypothetical protein
MPELFVAQLPIVSVYGDGRVITEGPKVTVDPPPALPNVLVRRISLAEVNALVARTVDHGVGRDIDFGQPDIYDAPGTRFTVLTDRGRLVINVYALGVDYGLNEAQISARRALQDLIDDLKDLPNTLGRDVADEQPYEPAALAAISREWTEPGSNQTAQPEHAWPGPTLPGQSMGRLPGLGCVTVTGASLGTVLDAAKTANVRTPWASDGRRWRVEFRPLLPDETSCADVI